MANIKVEVDGTTNAVSQTIAAVGYFPGAEAKTLKTNAKSPGAVINFLLQAGTKTLFPAAYFCVETAFYLLAVGYSMPAGHRKAVA